MNKTCTSTFQLADLLKNQIILHNFNIFYTQDVDAEASDNDNLDFDCESIDEGPCKLFCNLLQKKKRQDSLTLYHFEVPDECWNEVDGTESFYKCFERRYNACPAFSMGSLQQACEEAFKSTSIREVRLYLFANQERNLCYFSDVHYLSTFIMMIVCSAIYSVRLYFVR